LFPEYDAGRVLSRIDPAVIADELSATIQERCDLKRSEERPYDRIVLIGHSMGALLIRKSYVFACGQNHELWASGLRPAPRSWAEKVDRIILMAGMNRGWSFSPKPKTMSWPKCLVLRSADFAARMLGIASLMRAMKRGAPFGTNLRVQWLNLARSGHPMPPTIQILGDRDDIVSPEDNIDLQSGYNFIYLQAPSGTKHGNVVDLSDPGRRKVFVRALSTPPANLQTE
jgi:hypothetical protein